VPIHDFDPHQQFINIDKIPDHRSDQERLNSLLSIYNHDNPDIAYAERCMEEIINISGAWITIYKRLRNLANRDDVWEEDADPTYAQGIKLKGRFAPAPTEVQTTRWGVDISNQATIQFCRAVVFKQFNAKMIGEGDILIIPHNTLAVAQATDLRDGPANRIDTFRVLKSGDMANFKYRWLCWEVLCENITGDKTIQIDFRREIS
jgi:hypothetical protein